jgi:hypothetical protein
MLTVKSTDADLPCKDGWFYRAAADGIGCRVSRLVHRREDRDNRTTRFAVDHSIIFTSYAINERLGAKLRVGDFCPHVVDRCLPTIIEYHN